MFAKSVFSVGWRLVLASVLGGLGTRLSGESAGPWRLQIGRFGAAVVSDGEALYVIAGGTGDHVLGGIEKVDLKTGIVTELAARVVPRRFHSAVLMGRKIYVIGGESEEGIVTSVDVLNLDTMKVTTVGKMPVPRRGVSAVGVEDLIFTLGGSIAGEADDPRIATMQVYDGAKNKWLDAPSLPEPKEVPVLLHGHHLYTLGGYAGGEHAVSSCARYDLSTGKWETLASTPFTLSGYSAVSTRRAIFCFGDFVDMGRVAAYLPVKGTWSTLQVPFTPRRNSAACLVDGQVYVVGGNGQKLALDLIERFPVADLEAAVVRAAH